VHPNTAGTQIVVVRRFIQQSHGAADAQVVERPGLVKCSVTTRGATSFGGAGPVLRVPLWNLPLPSTLDPCRRQCEPHRTCFPSSGSPAHGLFVPSFTRSTTTNDNETVTSQRPATQYPLDAVRHSGRFRVQPNSTARGSAAIRMYRQVLYATCSGRAPSAVRIRQSTSQGQTTITRRTARCRPPAAYSAGHQ